MSPIVRRDDGEYRSDHRKKALAIGGVVRSEQEDDGLARWDDKEVDKEDRSGPSGGVYPYRDPIDPDIPASAREHQVEGWTDRDQDSGSSDHEHIHGLNKPKRQDEVRYSLGSNATYPPRPSASLDTLAELTTSVPKSRAHVFRAATSLLIQSTPSLIVSLIGLIFTGQLLDHLAVWDVFVKCDELFIAVPALQNLKGNLEMCLGAKLGTAVRVGWFSSSFLAADLISATLYRCSQTNEGRLDTPKRRKNIITNSLFFLQYQALSISALAGGLSWLLGYAMKHRIASPTPIPGSEDITEGYTKPGGKQLMLILSTGMLTASLSSAVLGNFISWLVVVCRWFGLNPGKSNLLKTLRPYVTISWLPVDSIQTDNIASPLAACLGDFLTLFILALVGSALVHGLSSPAPAIATLLMVIATIGVRWYGLQYKESSRPLEEKPSEAEEEGAWWPLASRFPWSYDVIYG
jgi:solute carrier family 41